LTSEIGLASENWGAYKEGLITTAAVPNLYLVETV